MLSVARLNGFLVKGKMSVSEIRTIYNIQNNRQQLSLVVTIRAALGLKAAIKAQERV